MTAWSPTRKTLRWLRPGDADGLVHSGYLDAVVSAFDVTARVLLSILARGTTIEIHVRDTSAVKLVTRR
jgi:hypothetical protein